MLGEAWERLRTRLDHEASNRLVRIKGLLATAQDGGIAGFETKTGGIGGHVRPRFIDNNYYANRCGDFLEFKSVGPDPFIEEPPDRVRQPSDFPQTASHACNSFIIKFKAIEHRSRKPHARSSLHIMRISLLND